MSAMPTVTCTNHGMRNRKMESPPPPKRTSPPVPWPSASSASRHRCMGQPVAHLAVRSSQNLNNT